MVVNSVSEKSFNYGYYDNQGQPRIQFKNIRNDLIFNKQQENKNSNSGLLKDIGLFTGILIGADFIFAKGKHTKQILKSFKGDNSTKLTKFKNNPEVKLLEYKPEIKPANTRVINEELKVDTQLTSDGIKPFTTGGTTSRWENPNINYTVDDISDVYMHHSINGYNSNVRSVFRRISEGTQPNELWLPYIQSTDDAFSKLQPLKKDCIVYRGRLLHTSPTRNIDFDIIDNAKIGDRIIPDLGYSYCGTERSLGEYYGIPGDKNRRSILYTIRLPKGSKVSRNLEHGGEVVMPRGAEYKLVSKEINGNHTNVTLEYILPKKDNLQESNELMTRFNLKKLSEEEILKAFE